jgi:hypothetical protein
MDDTEVVAGSASDQPATPTDSAGPTVTGFIATLAAMVATTLVAALAQAGGVEFEIPDSGGTIPLTGFAVVTGFLSVGASSSPSLYFGQFES